MDSPHMYDLAEDFKRSSSTHHHHLKVKCPTTPSSDGVDNFVPDLADLNTPEISFDLQNYISGSNPTPLEETNLFADILASSKAFSRSQLPNFSVPSLKPNNNISEFNFHMPQSAGFGSDRYGSEACISIKQEPSVSVDTGGSSQSISTSGATSPTHLYASYTTALQIGETSTAFATVHQELSLGSYPHEDSLKDELDSLKSTSTSSKVKSKKSVDKASDEYRRRRERNNIAVRKSREKAKQRSKDTERRVSDLVRENDSLRKKVELLSKELSVLKTLLANVGVSPGGISSEMPKSMGTNFSKLRQ